MAPILATLFAPSDAAVVPSGHAPGASRSAQTPTSLPSPSMHPGGDAVRSREERHHAPEVAHVAPHVAAIGLEIEDGVGHELAGAVVGDVAAPPGLVEGDAEPPARGLVGEDVRRLGAAPERDDRVVLEEEERVADRPPGRAPRRAAPGARARRRSGRAPSQCAVTSRIGQDDR